MGGDAKLMGACRDSSTTAAHSSLGVTHRIDEPCRRFGHLVET